MKGIIMLTAEKFKIYKQLSDKEMTSRGYEIDVEKNQSELVIWNKYIKFDENSPETYCIEIKERITDNGSYEVIPSIWFEHMNVEVQSLIDFDLDQIENLADELSKTFLKHFWN
jgi:hypothetical protein